MIAIPEPKPKPIPIIFSNTPTRPEVEKPYPSLALTPLTIRVFTTLKSVGLINEVSENTILLYPNMGIFSKSVRLYVHRSQICFLMTERKLSNLVLWQSDLFLAVSILKNCTIQAGMLDSVVPAQVELWEEVTTGNRFYGLCRCRLLPPVVWLLPERVILFEISSVEIELHCLKA